MRQRAAVKTLAGVVSVGLLLTGCSAVGGGGGDKTKVVYWSEFNKGEPLQVLLQKIADDFEAENPKIDIEINWAGRDVLTKLQGAVQAGTQVDIVDQSNDRLLNSVVLNDLALPLDDYFDEPGYGKSSGKWIDEFNPGAVEAFATEDGTFMVPRESYISGMWYNVKLLQEAGIEPSSTGVTWDEFLTYLETIAEKYPDVSPLGADASIDFYNNWWFTYLAIRLAGLEEFRAAGYDETGESWKQPAFLQAAEMVRELHEKGYFQDGYEGSVYPAMQAQFADSKVAMFLNGAWIPNEVGPQTPDGFEMSVFAFPNVDGGAGNDLVEYWANAFAVLKSTESPDEAVEFLKFALSPEKGGKALLEGGFPIPIAEGEVAAAFEGQVEILSEYETMGQRGGLNDEVPGYMTDVLNLCNDPFFTQKTSPTEFIDCLVGESEKYWSANPQ
jgi:raffinose/stachyose/melibiose transport system substrate-binding protein